MYFFVPTVITHISSINTSNHRGQVASGCQMVLFTTGNGALTNFPFVSTVKVLTTTRRYNLLKHDDLTLGDTLMVNRSKVSLASSLRICSSCSGTKRVLGEMEGSNPPQVSIWRDWYVNDDDEEEKKEQEKEYKQIVDVDKKSTLPVLSVLPELKLNTSAIGLILPTSLCSSETSRMIAAKLNMKKQEDKTFCTDVTRFAHLETTEGCGVVNNDFFHKNILTGILRSPLIKYSVLLEHGCEKNHNDSMRQTLRSKFETVPSNIGFESVQMGGGVRSAFSNVMRKCRILSANTFRTKTENKLRIGLVVDTRSVMSQIDIDSLQVFCRAVIDKWTGTIVSPSVSCLNCFQNTFKMRSVSLGDTISEDAGMVLLRGLTGCSMTLSETIGCVASSGVHVLVVMCSKSSNIVQAHPLIPTLLVTSSSSHSHDVDLRLGDDVLENARSWCLVHRWCLRLNAAHESIEMFIFSSLADGLVFRCDVVDFFIIF